MIIMKHGTYGLPVDGIIKGMNRASGKFSTTPEEENRLVALGLAEYVDEPTEAAPEANQTDGIPAFSEDMKATELREIGAAYGLIFKVGMSKVDMVAELTAFFDTEEAEADDEDAPTFDAAEAVQ